MPKRDVELNGVVVPLHVIGDPAYPLSKNLIKPYTGRNLTPQQESFNVYHSSARMVVENAFGRLKTRWRMLCKRMDCDINYAPVVIAAASCLHNLCEKHKTPMPTIIANVVESNFTNPQPDTISTANASQDGGTIRDTICIHLASNYPLRQSHHLH